MQFREFLQDNNPKKVQIDGEISCNE